MKITFYKAWAGGGTKLDRFISFWSGYPHSHCELIFSNGESFSSSSRDSGVRFKEIHYLPDRWDTLEIETDREDEIKQWCDKQVGKKYDYLGVFMYIPKVTSIQDKRRWYCSEICSTALKIGGYYEGKTTISPGSLFNTLGRNKNAHPIQ